MSEYKKEAIKVTKGLLCCKPALRKEYVSKIKLAKTENEISRILCEVRYAI